MHLRLRVILFAILFSVTVASFANVPIVSAQNPSPMPTYVNPDTNPVGANGETCGSEVSAIGWIVCAVAGAVLKVNDSMWWLAQYLLTLDPLQTTSGGHGQQDPVYAAWMAVRDVANVVFVIFFLMIIFSQLTSVGISNYGIKKMLPRLIVCAILVNVSFIIMQLAVDLSNIAGKGIYDFLKALAPPLFVSWWDAFWLIFTGGLTFALGGAAVGVTLLTLGIPAAVMSLVLVALAGLFALIVAVLTLIIRTAIIPILVILAPLAFVAYIFPNTQVWYKKWRDLLISMLMMYPLAGVVFGGSDFAAVVIVSRNPNNFFNHLMGLTILTLPLFSLPFLARQGGAILNAANGALTKLADKARKPAEERLKSELDLARAKRLNQDNQNPFHGMYKQMHYKRKNRETETKTNMEKFASRRLVENTRAQGLDMDANIAGKQTAIDKNTIAHLADVTQEGMKLDERIVKGGLISSADKAKTDTRVANDFEIGGGAQLHHELGAAKLQNEKDNAEIAHNLETDQGLLELRQGTAAAKKDLSAAQAKTAQITAELSTQVEDLGDRESSRVSQETRQRIQNAQQEGNITASATTSAQNIQRQEYHEALVAGDTDNPSATAVAAGGIDYAYGARRMAAGGAAGIEKALNDNVALIRSELNRRGVEMENPGNPDDPNTLLGMTRNMGLDVETRIAAIQQFAASASKGDMLKLADVAEMNKKVTGDSDEIAANKKLVQQAIGREVVRNKSETFTGGMIGKLSTGDFGLVKEDAAKTAMREKKYSTETIADMHYDEMALWKDTAKRIMDEGPVTAEDQQMLQSLRDKIDAVYGDDKLRHRIKDKARPHLDEMKAMIDARFGPTPPPSPPTP